jgi:HEAT repeat protein
MGQQTEAVAAVLADAVRGDDRALRAEALNAVTFAGAQSKAAVPVLEAALEKGDPASRMRAAGTLWQMDRGKKVTMFPLLLEGLKDNNRAVWGAAAQALGQVGPEAKEAIPLLVEMMRTRPEAMHAYSEVGNALWRMGEPAVRPLAELVATPGLSKQVLQGATQTLGRLGAPAVPALVPLLRHTDPAVRTTACQALTTVGPAARDAVPALGDLLKDGDLNVRRTAVSALGRVGPAARAAAPRLAELARDKKDLNLRLMSLAALRQVHADARLVLPLAKEAVKDDNAAIKAQGLELLWQADPRSQEVVPLALEMLKTPAGRYAALNLLGRMGPAAREAVPELVGLLKGNDQHLRQQALVALGNIGGGAGEAVPAMTGLLKDANVSTRQAAARALGQVGPAARRAVPELLRALDDKDSNTRQTIVFALRTIRPDGKAVVPRLLEVAKEDQTYARTAALDLLGEYGPEAAAAVPLLLDELKRGQQPYNRVRAADALQRIDPERARKEAVPVLRELLGPPAARVLAAGALLRIEPGDKDALAACEKALADANYGTRMQAADMIGNAGAAARGLAPQLRRLLKDPAANVRVSAAGALWRVTDDPKEALPVLLALLKEGDPLYVRAHAASKLGMMGPRARAAVPALLEAYRSGDANLRGAAGFALKIIDRDAAARAGVP